MKTITFLFIFGLSPLFIFAQDSLDFEPSYVGDRAFLDIVPEMEIAFPLGDFHSKIGKNVMPGKGMSIFYRLKNQPVDIGLRLGDIPYDNVKRNFQDSLDGVDLVQKSKNKIWLWYGVVRYEPAIDFVVQPYFEASFGFNRYFTKTFTKEANVVFTNEEDNNPRFDRATLNSDWGRTYGGAVGVKIILEHESNTALDLQVGYRSSDVGGFMIKNDLREVQVEPIDNFEERRGALSLVSLKIGLSVLVFSGE